MIMYWFLYPWPILSTKFIPLDPPQHCGNGDKQDPKIVWQGVHLAWAYVGDFHLVVCDIPWDEEKLMDHHHELWNNVKYFLTPTFLWMWGVKSCNVIITCLSNTTSVNDCNALNRSKQQPLWHMRQAQKACLDPWRLMIQRQWYWGNTSSRAIVWCWEAVISSKPNLCL